MKRVHANRPVGEQEARAMREHQLRVESKNQFIQVEGQKLKKLYELWNVAGFPFIPKRTYQPSVLWEMNGVSGGLSLLRFHRPASIRYGEETDHRLVMAKAGAALHHIKETPRSCEPQIDLTLDEVYEVLEALESVEGFCENLDEVIEILISFNQHTVELADEQTQR